MANIFIFAIILIVLFNMIGWKDHGFSGTRFENFIMSIIIAMGISGFYNLFSEDGRGWGIAFMIISSVMGYINQEYHNEKERENELKYKESQRERERQRPERERKQREQEEKQRREEAEIQANERKKREVELKAMYKAMSYEKNNYRKPEDVSSQNIGYDIKSRRSDETRFIEVKGKGKEGNVLITTNEWNKAKELENNYFLYVVYNCYNDYQNLHIVQNPANTLNADYNYSTGKYSISLSEVRRYSC